MIPIISLFITLFIVMPLYPRRDHNPDRAPRWSVPSWTRQNSSSSVTPPGRPIHTHLHYTTRQAHLHTQIYYTTRQVHPHTHALHHQADPSTHTCITPPGRSIHTHMHYTTRQVPPGPGWWGRLLVIQDMAIASYSYRGVRGGAISTCTRMHGRVVRHAVQ